jgi:hypothetical protein
MLCGLSIFFFTKVKNMKMGELIILFAKNILGQLPSNKLDGNKFLPFGKLN